MKKKNILITGGHGYLGKIFVHQAINSKNFNVFCLSDRIESLSEDTFKPDVIVHLAYKNIGFKGDIIKENYSNLNFLSNIAIKNNAHFIFLSSDYVFKEDKNKQYLINNDYCPNTDYGHSKVVCENYVKNNFTKSTILRTSMLYGYYNKNRDNFVRSAFDKFSNNENFEVYDNVFCRPTHVKDLSNYIIKCIDEELFGIFHTVSDHLVNRVDLAKQICIQNNFNLDLVKVISKNSEAIFPASLDIAPSKEFIKMNKYSIYNDLKMFGEKND